MTLFDAAAPSPEVRRVSLVRLSAEVARAAASVGRVAVEGEVHRPSNRPGGRIYFTLKDRAAQIKVTCPAARSKRCRVVAGERVEVSGRLEWVSGWGDLQLVADTVVPVGAGAVAAMIAEARARLLAEGLIDRPRRGLPRLPLAIGVVCGSDAAVRADIESVVAARFAGYPLHFREVPVSGPSAADAIIEALVDLDRRSEVEVIILARGGGDATQLLPFSDEALCRAICACSTPVVAAIGHEGDRPLCDEVVDLRCGTPSLAAAAVVPDRETLEVGLAAQRARATTVLERRYADATRQLSGIDRTRAVTQGFARAGARLQQAGSHMALVHPHRRVAGATAALDGARRQMDALSPVRVLERGYAVVRAADGSVVRDAAVLSIGSSLSVQLASGRAGVRVEEVVA